MFVEVSQDASQLKWVTDRQVKSKVAIAVVNELKVQKEHIFCANLNLKEHY